MIIKKTNSKQINKSIEIENRKKCSDQMHWGRQLEQLGSCCLMIWRIHSGVVWINGQSCQSGENMTALDGLQARLSIIRGMMNREINYQS